MAAWLSVFRCVYNGVFFCVMQFDSYIAHRWTTASPLCMTQDEGDVVSKGDEKNSVAKLYNMIPTRIISTATVAAAENNLIYIRIDFSWRTGSQPHFYSAWVSRWSTSAQPTSFQQPCLQHQWKAHPPRLSWFCHSAIPLQMQFKELCLVILIVTAVLEQSISIFFQSSEFYLVLYLKWLWATWYLVCCEGICW